MNTKYKLWLGYVVALAAALFLVSWSFFLFRTQWTLEVLWHPQQDGQSQLFYDTGSGFSEWESVRREVRAEHGLQWTEFSFRAGPLLHLRLDPCESEGRFQVHKIQLRRRNEAQRWELPLTSWQGANQVASWQEEPDGRRLQAEAGANDMFLVYQGPLPSKMGWNSIWGWFVPGIVGIAAACLFIHVRGFRWGGLLLVLTLVGTHLVILDRYGSDLPDWDDWIAIGSDLLVREADGELSTGHWFAGWNEHRILWTRLLIYGAIMLNQQWDNLVLGMLATGLATLMYWGVYRCFAPMIRESGWWRPWVGWLAIIIAAPVAWQNFFWGFALQNYFVPLFAFATFLMLNRQSLGWREFLLGTAMGIAGLFSMGAGLVCGGVLIAWGVVLALSDSKALRWRNLWVRAGCGGLVLLVGGILLMGTTGQSYNQAESVVQFVTVWLQLLSWPFSEMWWVGLLLWSAAPVTLLVLWKQKQSPDRVLRLALAGALWVGAMAAATAFSRSKVALDHVHRYGDFLALGMIVQFVLWFYLWNQCRQNRGLRWTLGGALVLFMVLTGGRMAERGLDVIVHYMPRLEEYYMEGESRTAAFVHDREKKYVDEGYLPFFEYDQYQEWLDHPGIRAVLPPSAGAFLALSEPQYLEDSALATSGSLFRYISSWTEPLEDQGRRVRFYTHPHFRNGAHSISFHRPPLDPFWERVVGSGQNPGIYRMPLELETAKEKNVNSENPTVRPEQSLANWYFVETTGGVVNELTWTLGGERQGRFYHLPDALGTRAQDRWVAKIPKGEMDSLEIVYQFSDIEAPLQISQPRAAGPLRVVADWLFAFSQYLLAAAIGMLPIWLMWPVRGTERRLREKLLI